MVSLTQVSQDISRIITEFQQCVKDDKEITTLEKRLYLGIKAYINYISEDEILAIWNDKDNSLISINNDEVKVLLGKLDQFNYLLSHEEIIRSRSNYWSGAKHFMSIFGNSRSTVDMVIVNQRVVEGCRHFRESTLGFCAIKICHYEAFIKWSPLSKATEDRAPSDIYSYLKDDIPTSDEYYILAYGIIPYPRNGLEYIEYSPYDYVTDDWLDTTPFRMTSAQLDILHEYNITAEPIIVDYAKFSSKTLADMLTRTAMAFEDNRINVMIFGNTTFKSATDIYNDEIFNII
jgi:hypothetical protein